MLVLPFGPNHVRLVVHRDLGDEEEKIILDAFRHVATQHLWRRPVVPISSPALPSGQTTFLTYGIKPSLLLSDTKKDSASNDRPPEAVDAEVYDSNDPDDSEVYIHLHIHHFTYGMYDNICSYRFFLRRLLFMA